MYRLKFIQEMEGCFRFFNRERTLVLAQSNSITLLDAAVSAIFCLFQFIFIKSSLLDWVFLLKVRLLGIVIPIRAIKKGLTFNHESST